MWKIFQHINIIFLRSLSYREVIYIVGWSQTGRIIWCSVALINIEWWWWVHCDDDGHWCAGGEEMLETGDAGEWLQVSGVTLMRVLSVGEWSCKHWLSLTTRTLTRELWEQEAASLSLSLIPASFYTCWWSECNLARSTTARAPPSHHQCQTSDSWFNFLVMIWSKCGWWKTIIREDF